MESDRQLLQHYAHRGSDRAFTELVQRHLNLVYSAALRQTEGDRPLAEEVAQEVFIRLAQQARRLVEHPALVGWLYRTTRYAAIDARRAHHRRQRREQPFTPMSESLSQPEAAVEWERLRPLLDEALNALSERDRQVVLLRFFAGRSYQELGEALGATENTARMRVIRALDKLRLALERRGLASSSAALATTLEQYAVTSAPPGLAAHIVSTSLAGATAGGAMLSTVSIFLMPKTTVPALALLVIAGSAGTWFALRKETAGPDDHASRPATAVMTAAPLARMPDTRQQLTAKARAVRSYNAQFSDPATPMAPPRSLLRNRGVWMPTDAIETFGWACHTANVEAIAKQIFFEDAASEIAETVWARLPDEVRHEWPTPELLYGLLVAFDCIDHPPPLSPEVLKQAQLVYLRYDRVEFRFPGGPGRKQQYQLTDQGWKIVFPEVGVTTLARHLQPEAPSSREPEPD